MLGVAQAYCTDAPGVEGGRITVITAPPHVRVIVVFPVRLKGVLKIGLLPVVPDTVDPPVPEVLAEVNVVNPVP